MPLPTAPFDTTKSLFAGLNVIQFEPDSGALSAVTAEADDDIFTKTAHGLADGDIVVFASGTGFTGITAGTNYYVRDKTDDTFKLAATAAGAAIDITVDGSAGVFRPTEIFESKKLDHQYAPEYFEHKRPDAKGVQRIARKILVGSTESWMHEVDEAKRLLDLFSNSLAGIVDGIATLWQPDPDDGAGEVALKSERFACTIEREGDLAGGSSSLSIAQIKITSKKLGPVTFTADATA
ncbi:MAG: hypothetical protein ACREIA_24210 [Opitutaceae bacterium]